MAVSPPSSSMEATTAMKQPQSDVPASQGMEPMIPQLQQTALVAPFASVPQQQQANNNNNNHNAFATPPPPGIMQPYSQIGPPRGSVQPPQVAPIPFYRPLSAPPPASAVQNPSVLQPPGVSSASAPQTLNQTPQQPQQHNPQTLGSSNPHIQVLGFGQQVPPGASAASAIPVSPVRPPGLFPVSTPMQYQQQPPRPYPTTPNGYSTMPLSGPPGTQPQQQPQMMNPSVLGGAPAGMPRYSAPYPPMVRPTFPPRPPGAMGVMPLPRPPIPGVRAVPPVLKFPPATGSDPTSKGVIPLIPPTEKPQTTVYVGKISPTVDNEFLLSLLELCGPIKSWKRAQDPTNGTPKGFGFCEFENAEGVLRALRLLNKFSLEGQELVLNVNQATREYLERFVEKKSEREKQIKEAELQDADKEEETAPGVEKIEPPKPPAIGVLSKDNNDSLDQGNQDGKKFGIVNDADRQADEEALTKLTNMLEERAKLKPLPPPPPLHPGSDAPGKSMSTSEVPARSRDADSDVEIVKSDIHDEKNEDDTASENKPTSEHERPETSSSDRGRRYDRSRERDSDRSRERDRERDLKREKERELERYERERERERLRREREREMRIREVERLYEEREREWEARERDKERQRQYEREREKERERERRREIKEQEEESDDEDWRKRRHRSSMFEEKRKRRQREKEDDLSDQIREEQEIAEAKKRKFEDNRHEEDSKALLLSDRHESASLPVDEIMIDHKRSPMDQGYGSDSGEEFQQAEASLGNGNASVSGDEAAMEQMPDTDSRQNIGAPARKLGFGLIGSGKRAAVPSVFHQEDDEDTHKEKKMRPLVPIDYSAEEMQAVSATPPPVTVSSLSAAAEFGKRISVAGSKERVDPEKERSRKQSPEKDRGRKQSDRSGQKERENNDNESNRSREENKVRNRESDRSREKYHDRDDAVEKSKALENKKLLDAKQLIDTIPKTKEALFAYNIDWAIYDKYDLHERMRPWISKKITEFLGEEETTLVDFVVSKTKKHVAAAHMLELLESILDEEAEMFVLKMWRMLIFEIKKVETGLASKAKT